MDKTYEVESGTLRVQSFDLNDENMDIIGHFDGIFSSVVDSPTVLIHETMETLEVSRAAFLDQFKSEEAFKETEQELQFVVVEAMQWLSFKFADKGSYASCNGCALFQLWILSLIHGREDDQKYMEMEIFELNKALNS